jgi:hypothetical protein
MRIPADWLNRQTISAACLGAIVVLCANHASSVDKTAPRDRIDDLVRKRVTLLEEYERAIKERIRIDPQMSHFEMRAATVAVLNARLDLAKSPQDHMKALEEMAKAAEEWEQLVRGLIENGTMGKWEGLKAKAQVLESQISLERFKETVKQSTTRP